MSRCNCVNGDKYEESFKGLERYENWKYTFKNGDIEELKFQKKIVSTVLQICLIQVMKSAYYDIIIKMKCSFNNH